MFFLLFLLLSSENVFSFSFPFLSKCFLSPFSFLFPFSLSSLHYDTLTLPILPCSSLPLASPSPSSSSLSSSSLPSSAAFSIPFHLYPPPPPHLFRPPPAPNPPT